MKKTIWASALLIYFALLFFIWTIRPQPAHSATISPPILSDRQQVWLDALIWCESKDVPGAINPKDRDGTPPYGLLQFKPSTLSYFEQKYGITGPLMSSSTQREIVTQMILRGGIDWYQQFPMCTSKLGTPPA